MLGIDVSKDNLACTYTDPISRKILWHDIQPNTIAGINTLQKKTPLGSSWVVEPTGRYSHLVVEQATKTGQVVLLAPPRQAKAFLQSVQRRAKTDKLDAQGLALFALSVPLQAYRLKEPAVQSVMELLSARKGVSLCLSRLQQQMSELPAAAQHLQGAIADLKARLAALDKQIAKDTKDTPSLSVASALDAVPGIGKVTAAAVAARLVSKSFTHPDQFVAYIGLDVSVSDSGKHKGRRGLTHQGDAELRRLLYLCAQANLRCRSSPFKDQYERERTKGLSTTAALCAVARKIARLCWSLHKYGSEYDAARVTRQGGSGTRDTLPVEESTVKQPSST